MIKQIAPYHQHGTEAVSLTNRHGSTTEQPLPAKPPKKPKSPLRCSPDKLLATIGPKNRYVLFIWLAMGAVWGVGALTIMASVFLMDATNNLCTSKPEEEEAVNGTTTMAPTTTLQPGSVTEEFKLNSENGASLVYWSTSAYIGGMTLSSICMPPIADKYGRRPALLASLLLNYFAGIATAMSPNIYVFIVMRLFQGLSFSGCILVNWVLAYECIPLALRSHTALVFGLFWVFGYCMVGPLAYLLPNWRILITVVSTPSFVYALIYAFTIPESLHFLVSKRQIIGLRKWIRTANRWAEWAGTRLIEQNELNTFLDNLQTADNNDSSTDASETGIIINPKTAYEKKHSSPTICYRLMTCNWGASLSLCLYLVVSVYIWSVDTFIYYGLSLFSTTLAGDRYVNFTLVGLVEIPSYVFAPLFLERMGRRWFTVFMHLLAAIAFLCVWISAAPAFYLVLWLIGKFAISSSFTGLFVYSSELFPTTHRNLCIGICSTLSQASAILVPPIVCGMSKWSRIAPMIFFGICSLVASAVTLLLPETKGNELPCSYREIKEINKVIDIDVS